MYLIFLHTYRPESAPEEPVPSINTYLNLLIRDYEVLCLVRPEKAVVFRCLNTYNSVKIKYPEMKRLFEHKCLIQMHMDKMALRAKQCDEIMREIAINILAKQVSTEQKFVKS